MLNQNKSNFDRLTRVPPHLYLRMPVSLHFPTRQSWSASHSWPIFWQINKWSLLQIKSLTSRRRPHLWSFLLHFFVRHILSIQHLSPSCYYSVRVVFQDMKSLHTGISSFGMHLLPWHLAEAHSVNQPGLQSAPVLNMMLEMHEKWILYLPPGHTWDPHAHRRCTLISCNRYLERIAYGAMVQTWKLDLVTDQLRLEAPTSSPHFLLLRYPVHFLDLHWRSYEQGSLFSISRP